MVLRYLIIVDEKGKESIPVLQYKEGFGVWNSVFTERINKEELKAEDIQHDNDNDILFDIGWKDLKKE